MTPCEKLGYKVGDRFVVITGWSFTEGSIVALLEDDQTDCPSFLLIEGYTQYGRIACTHLTNVKKLPKEIPMITLQQGDAVCLKGQPLDIRERLLKIFSEASGDTSCVSQYRQVCLNSNYLEWVGSEILVPRAVSSLEPNARILTVEQVLSTETQESPGSPTNTKSDALERLMQAKESLDNAQKHFDDMMQEVQNEYPTIVISFLENTKGDPLPFEEWLPGDIVEAVENGYGFIKGEKYELLEDDDGDVCVVDSEGDPQYCLDIYANLELVWHSRPQK